MLQLKIPLATTKIEDPMGHNYDPGTHAYLWPIHADVWQQRSQYCKVLILQLKLIN